MNVKEYLEQAKYLNIRVQTKLDQMKSLEELATSCTSIISEMPKGGNKTNDKMAQTVCSIVEIENELNEEIKKLLEVKREISKIISSMKTSEYATLLEKRYLCYARWEQIAIDMGYSMQHIYRIHKQALQEFQVQFENRRVNVIE